MSRNKLIGLAVLALVVILGFKACSSDPQPQQVAVAPVQQVQQAPQQVAVQPAPVQEVAPQYDQQQPNVVVVQQPPQTVVQQAPSHDGFFTGMVMGHLMSRGNSGYSSHRTTVINKTIVQRPSRSYYGSRPSYTSRSYSRPSRSFSRPSRSFSRRR